MSTKLKDTLAAIMEQLHKISSTETVVGKPIILGDKKVVPVSRIMVGFGVGGTEEGHARDSENFSGGGAGGARVDPIGFIIIQEDKVSFLPTKPGKFEGLIESIPGIIDTIKNLKGGEKGKDLGKSDKET